MATIPSVKRPADERESGEAKKREKSFRELFALGEIIHYSVAAVIYIALGLWLKDVVLNWVVGPLYIVAWMWIIPPLVNRARGK